MSTITGWLGKSAPISEILYFKSEDKCVTAYHSGGEIILSRTILALSLEYAGDFVQCFNGILISRSRIVAYIKHKRGGEGEVFVRGVIGSLPVSRRYSTGIPQVETHRFNSSRMTKEKYAANVLAGESHAN